MQYGTPCIVTASGGCIELIQHGINGYIVPMDMDFDINIIKKIPKVKNYDNGVTAKTWCDFLGEAKYKVKKLKIPDTNIHNHTVKAVIDFSYGKFNECKNIIRNKTSDDGRFFIGDIFDCTKEMYEYLNSGNDQKLKLVELIGIERKKKNDNIRVKKNDEKKPKRHSKRNRSMSSNSK